MPSPKFHHCGDLQGIKRRSRYLSVNLIYVEGLPSLAFDIDMVVSAKFVNSMHGVWVAYASQTMSISSIEY